MDKMKDYRQLIKELPSRTIVCAFGEFNPPTTGHELLVKTVNKLAEQRNSDHVIFTSPSKNNSLVEEKKSQYLKLMFPKTKFKLSESKISSIKSLSERYKNIVVVAGSEHSTDLKKALKEYTNIEVISITEKDPDALDSKMKTYATKGIYEEFKKKLPSTIRELDARRLMNDMRETMGLDSVKEQIVLVKDKLRDDYFRGQVFNVGDIVESDGVKYTIAKRGSNHLLLKESSGALVSKWIHDVQPTEEKEMNEELTDKTLKVTDKIKVARIIATMLGVENVESSSNPQNLVNTALRKVRSKALNPESLNIINKMLRLAAEVGIEYDNTLVPSKLKEGTIQPNGTSQIDTPVDAPKVLQKIQRKAKVQDKLPIKFTDFTKNIYNKEVDPEPIGPEPQADTDKQNDSDIDADFDTKDMDKKEVGHTLVSPGGQDNLRRRKIKYHLGEQKGPYEKESGHENTAQHVISASSKEHGSKTKKLAKSFLDRMQSMAESTDTLDEAAWGQDKMANLKAAHDRHFEKAISANRVGDHDAVKVHQSKMNMIKNQMNKLRKEDVDVSEGLQQKLRKFVPGYAKKQINQKMDAEKFGRTDADRDVNYHRYKKILDKTNEDVDVDKKALTGSFKGFVIANMQRKVEEAYKEPPESVQDRLYRQQQELRKKRGLPDPSHYKKMAAQKAAEIEALHKEIEADKKKNMSESEDLKKNIECPSCVDGKCQCPPDEKDKGIDQTQINLPSDPFFKEESEEDDELELSDKEIDQMIDKLHDDDYLEAYDEELSLVDDETGEELEKHPDEDKLSEDSLMEVLSRTERIKAKFRLRRTASKRQRATKIALKRYSSVETVNKRARRLAIMLMKKRMLRGRNLSQISVGEKERIERTIAKRKNIIGRIASKLVSRVRKVEKARMSHSKFTQGGASVSF
jgi:hypothetical protein